MAEDIKEVRHESSCFGEGDKKLPFLVTLVIWYDLLTQINLESKILQTQNVNLGEAVSFFAEDKSVRLQL